MPPTKKIFTLDINLDFLDNVHVLGIQAPLLPLHRLAYFLNERAQWRLTRMDDYSVHEADKDAMVAGGGVAGGAMDDSRRRSRGDERGGEPQSRREATDGGVATAGVAGGSDSRAGATAGAGGSDQPEDESELYALLQHTLPLERLNIFLLENKNPEPLVKAENCDYFLMACGETARYDFDALTAIVEGIESVFSVYPIDVRRHDALKRFFMIKKRFPEI